MMGVRQHFSQLLPRPDALLELVVSDLVGSSAGIQGRTLTLPTGQLATFARASAGAGADGAGDPYDAPPHHTALQVTADRVGILLRPEDAPRAVETLSAAYVGRIVPHSGYLRYVDRGAAAVADARYLQWGSADSPRLILLRGSSGPEVSWSAGVGTVSSQPAGHASAGQLVELHWRLTAAGEVQVSRRYASGSWVAGPLSSAGLVPPQNPAQPVITIGGGPGAANVGGIELQALRIHPDPDRSVDRLSAGTGL